KEPEPADEGEVIPARELMAATTAEVLGKNAEPGEKSGDGKTDTTVAAASEAKPAEAKSEPEPKISGISPVPPSKPKPAPKKPKPLAVASTPLIGNYQLPPLDFLLQ